MEKIAILFQEEETKKMDLSHPELGNPGVGGTAFCFLLLCKYIQDNPDVEITVYQFQDNILPCNRCVKVNDVKEALTTAKEDGNTIVLLRNHQTDDVYEEMKNHDFRYILWMHNKLTYEEIRLFSTWDKVKRIVCVSREMYDYYVDDPVIEKMDLAWNIFVPPSEEKIRKNGWPPRVTFVGSLTYDKNFHLLAAVWKQILAAVPEAELHVIGSGKLYDKNSVMGKTGYAEKEYEDLFLPHICDDNGELLESVVFHGILGDEKYDVFKESAVGVANPMATETFCLCAIEMEACGVPVVSRRKNGLVDTVMDGKTGILYPDISGLAPAIIRLLKDEHLNREMGQAAQEFARDFFLPERIIPEWIRIFQEVSQDRKPVYHKPRKNMDNNGKRIRVMVHGIRKIPFLRRIPSIHDLQKK